MRRGVGTWLFCWSIALLICKYAFHIALPTESILIQLFIFSAILFACNIIGEPVSRPTKRAGDNGNESED